MTIRTIRTTVVFTRPFTVIGLDAMQPAGVYTVETHDELFDGVSLPDCRRIGTSIFLPARPARRGWVDVAQIDPRELDAATNESRPVLRRDNSKSASWSSGGCRLDSPGAEVGRHRAAEAFP
jgi:hypothetical protein